MEEMDSKPYQPLSKARHEMEMAYTSSSDESEDGRRRAKSYTSRETLPDYGQELRLNYNSHSKRQTTFSETTQEIDFAKTQPQMLGSSYQEELCPGPQLGYSLGMGSDVEEDEVEGDPSPSHALHLWMQEVKSEQSSCLSSRANSVLSLTDTEQERKSDAENDNPSSPATQFTFRPLPPPPPPPHACTCARPAPYAHVTLQRSTMPAQSHARDRDGQGTDGIGQNDSSQVNRNNWVLNSNIPLETRHFLFKHGSGSSTLLSAANQNYPLTSNTVYSPPPRPLPRSTFSRPMFTFNKPYKCCNWKCTALSASAITVTLALLLTYVIAVHLFGLTWHLRPADPQLYENGVSKLNRPPDTSLATLPPLEGLGPDKSPRVKGEKLQRGRAIDRGEVDIGAQVSQVIPPSLFWRFHLTVHHPTYVKFNLSLSREALLGVYGRRNLPPTHTQFDFVKLLDGKHLLKVEPKGPETPGPGPGMGSGPRNQPLSGLQETGFIEYMDPGTWHLALYNDGKKMETVLILSTPIDTMDGCSTSCNGNGECVAGHCHCFPGFLGPNCEKVGEAESAVLSTRIRAKCRLCSARGSKESFY
ncbi:hypothetical protein AALO_G00267690 [Alosa alosa]|uniref:Teneurin-1 n=1 Tax=Alosa alosa TaxID=278164 RepID=A0AAV6FLE4_9TELE|nr:hypothetical protein AALO_G00267690 [Alosa alosa]